jgi:hypothetical protein
MEKHEMMYPIIDRHFLNRNRKSGQEIDREHKYSLAQMCEKAITKKWLMGKKVTVGFSERQKRELVVRAINKTHGGFDDPLDACVAS